MNLHILEEDSRYAYADFPYGIAEDYPLDFHSPYGCSKGSGDQYTRDYARIYGLKTLTFRQSCIYGRRQFGVEDQGWVAVSVWRLVYDGTEVPPHDGFAWLRKHEPEMRVGRSILLYHLPDSATAR